MGWHRMREHEPQAGDAADGDAVARPGSAETGADPLFWASPVGQAARAKLRGDHFFQIELDDAAIAAYAESEATGTGRRARHTYDLLGQIEELGWHLEHVAWWPVDSEQPTTELTSEPTSQATAAVGDTEHVRGVYLFHSLPEAGAHAAPHSPTHRRESV
jgi:hypothetical protein